MTVLPRCISLPSIELTIWPYYLRGRKRFPLWHMRVSLAGALCYAYVIVETSLRSSIEQIKGLYLTIWKAFAIFWRAQPWLSRADKRKRCFQILEVGTTATYPGLSH